MSDSNLNRNPNAKPKVAPPRFKLGVLAGIAIVILFVIGVFAFNHENSENPHHLIKNTESESKLGEIGAQNSQIAFTNNETNERYRELKDEIIRLKKNIIDSWNQDKQNQSDIAQIRSHLAEQAALIETLQSSLFDNNKEVISLSQRIKEFEIQFAPKKTVGRKRARRKFKANHPPFTLVTIDHWNLEPNAVFEANGQLHPLTQGTRFLNWIVQAIDTETGRVTLRNDRGRIITLH